MTHPLDALSQSIQHYGSAALFGLLAIGIIGMPIPDETLLVFAGYLMAKGKLGIAPTMIAAYSGSIFGITISYLIGSTAGHFLVMRYGSWIGITPARVERAHRWFEKFGPWLLVFGYFIPGVRHLTGYIAGAVELSWQRFIMYAFSGAIMWATLFLAIGYFSIDKWIGFLTNFADFLF